MNKEIFPVYLRSMNANRLATPLTPTARRVITLIFFLVSLPIGAGATFGHPTNFVDRVELSAPQISAAPQGAVIVPLTISDTTDLGIIAYQFNIRYDPTVLQISSVPIDMQRTLSETMAFAVNPTVPGLLRIAAYGPYPLNSEGVLLNLRFTAVGNVGDVSDLSWEDVLVNEGNPSNSFINGSVTIGVPIVNQLPVRGRIVRGGLMNQFVPYGRVELVGADGVYRTVLANSKGYFEFRAIPTDQTYTVSASTGLSRSRPVVISVLNGPLEIVLNDDSTEVQKR